MYSSNQDSTRRVLLRRSKQLATEIAAYTVRLAYRVFRCNPSDPALKILADAVGLMNDPIESLLADYLENITMSDSKP